MDRKFARGFNGESSISFDRSGQMFYISGHDPGARCMADLIRSASLTHYAALARSVGLQPEKMLRRVRLPLNCLVRHDLRIPVRNVRRLLEISANLSGVETFALRLAERGDLSNLGPLALLIREQATIGT